MNADFGVEYFSDYRILGINFTDYRFQRYHIETYITVLYIMFSPDSITILYIKV